MKVILLGSPEITIPTFKQVIRNFQVVSIITQADKKKGRGMKIDSTPVAKLAKQFHIPLYKPEKISSIYEELKKIKFDILLSFAYGQIIPKNILKLGQYPPINIHGSILPKYRGASPIQYAILNNDKKIGISLIEMIDKMDAGDIYFQDYQNISHHTTSGEGFEIISQLAEKNIVSWLNKIKNNDFVKIKQKNYFSLAPKIDKKFTFLSPNDSIKFNMRKIKAFNPFPGAFLFKDNKRIKIFNASLKKVTNSIPIHCNNGVFFAIEFKIEGKKITKL